MKKVVPLLKKIVPLLVVIVICNVFFESCDTYETIEYYADKTHYIKVVGVVTHIQYNDTNDTLYLGFSDLVPSLDDTSFKIVGSSLDIVRANGIDNKITIGSRVEFMTAPRYYGDGYVMPIVALTVDGSVLLEFEDGYMNWNEMLKNRK